MLYLNTINHNPIDLGDNLPPPGSLTFDTGTWWGFPTWRETLSFGWADPTVQLNLEPGSAHRPDTAVNRHAPRDE